ncbi:MAG: hypothetical protein KC505_11505, partial [Myxococcales bacterium]|nr:hypothetical protein [Myxococcales bacterium]
MTTIDKLIKKHVFITLKNFDGIPCYHFACDRVLHELLLPLDPHSHKGTFGHVLALQGHENFIGASRLSLLGALRAGTGLATLLCKDSIQHHPADLFEFIKIKDRDLTIEYLKKISALVIGPGLSKDTNLQNWGLEMLHQAGAIVPNIIIDADALNLLKRLDPAFMGTSV